MPQPKNAMEIFQLLDKSNCRECGEKTCLAFAGAVLMGQKKPDKCPKLDRETIVFFDAVTDENLDIDSVFTLGAGLAQMFQKLALRHGYPEAVSSLIPPA